MLTRKGTQTIRTQRLTLRRFTLDDAPAMFNHWANDPEVTKFLTWPPHGSVEVTRAVLSEWIANYEIPHFYNWAIEFEGVLVGNISAIAVYERAEKVAIGYCMGRNWWHRGVMSEALAAVIGFFFDEVSCGRIEAWHDVNNPNSGAVMRKCGMVYEGTQHHSDWNNMGICDTAHYAILREDWEA